MNTMKWKATLAIGAAVCLAAVAVLLLRGGGPDSGESRSKRTASTSSFETPGRSETGPSETTAPSSSNNLEVRVIETEQVRVDPIVSLTTQPLQMTKQPFDAPAELLNPGMPAKMPASDQSATDRNFQKVPMNEEGLPVGNVPFPDSPQIREGEEIPVEGGFLRKSKDGPRLDITPTATPAQK